MGRSSRLNCRTARSEDVRHTLPTVAPHCELNVYAAQISRKSLDHNLSYLNSDLLAPTDLRTHAISSLPLQASTLTSPLGKVRFCYQDACICSLMPCIWREVIYKYVSYLNVGIAADSGCADLEVGYFLANKITLRSMLSRGMESQFSSFRWFIQPLKR